MPEEKKSALQLEKWSLEKQINEASTGILKTIFLIIVLYLAYHFLSPYFPEIKEKQIDPFFEDIQGYLVENGILPEPESEEYTRPKADNPEDVEDFVLRYTNGERSKYGLSLFYVDSKLSEAARYYSRCIAENGSENCGSIYERYTMFGINNTGAENVCEQGYGPYYTQEGEPIRNYSEKEIAEETVLDMITCLENARNIYNENYTHMGVGVYMGEETVIIVENFMVEEYCGWKGEACCQIGISNYSCYDSWECNKTDMTCN